LKDNLDLLKFSFDFLFEKLKNKLEILHYKNTFRFDSDDETTESYKDQKVIEKEVPKAKEEDIPKAKEEEVFESVKRLDDPQ
jgi:tRNA(Met) C34 N-acetyltransferase TmcA